MRNIENIEKKLINCQLAVVFNETCLNMYMYIYISIRSGTLVLGQNVDRQNVDRHNFEQTKCRTDIMSNRQNIDRQNAEQTKCRQFFSFFFNFFLF